MIKKVALLAGAIGLATLTAGCQTQTDWAAVAQGAGMVIRGSGATKDFDPKVAQVSAQLAQYCPALQIAAAIGVAALPESKRAAGLAAAAAFNEVCTAPPADVAAAVIVAQKAYAAAQAARITTAPS